MLPVEILHEVHTVLGKTLGKMVFLFKVCEEIPSPSVGDQEMGNGVKQVNIKATENSVETPQE